MAEEKTNVVTETLRYSNDFTLDESYLITTGSEGTGVQVMGGSFTVDGAAFEGNKTALYIHQLADDCTITNAEFSAEIME